MKKNFLLLFLMCLLGGMSSSLLAQETVQIGTIGDFESNIYPYISTYNYSTSQQIYKASEIGKGGTISKIAFHVSDEGVNKKVYDVKIYIKHTTKDAFASKTDWDKTVTSEHLVYDGNPDITNSLLEIPLTTPFEYDGTQNLLVCFDVNSKQGAATYYRTYSADSKRVMYYRNANNYGPDATNYYNNAASSNPSNMIPVITLTFGGSVQAKDPEFTDTYAYPSNNATGIFNPYLKFYAENKTHYKVLLSTSEDFSANVTYVAGSATTWVESPASVKEVSTANISGLTYNPATTYYWKVIASNGGGADDPTAEKVYSFTTKEVTTNPGAVTNMLPEDGATGLLNPELTWTYGDNTVDYQVIIDDEVKVDWTNIGYATTGSYQTSDLSSGEHTWQVNTRNNNETYTSSDVYTFYVASLPDNVTPISPADGATGVTSDVIRFQFAEGTTEYRLLYSNTTTAEMGYIRVDQGGTGSTWTSTGGVTEMEFTIPGFGLGKTLYWAVDVKNAIGQRSVWNGGEEVAIYSFTAASTLPVANVAPEDGAYNLDNPTLTWNYVGAARHYMVYLGTDENNLTAQTDWLAREQNATGYVGNGSYETENLDAATTYFWRVDIKDEAGNVITGATWSFVTTLKAPQNVSASPENVEPSSSLTYGETTIMWNTNDMTGVLGYNVYLNDNKLNNEQIAPTQNSYKIEANTRKLTYNMNPGHKINVEAVYELGTSMSEDIYVKVSGAGYFVGIFYSNDYNNKLAGATVTLTRTEDEFGNVYEDNGKQYTYTTNSDGKVYYEQTQPDEEIEQITQIGILDGTYNVTVEKACYETYEGTITITNDNTSAIGGYDGMGNYGVILKEDPAVRFDVSYKENSFESIKIYLANSDWEDKNEYLLDEYGNVVAVTKYFGEGYYNVYYEKDGITYNLEDPQWFSQDGRTSVYFTYTDWAFLGKGDYKFGVAKVEGQTKWSSSVASRNYDVFEGRTDEWSRKGNWRDGEFPSEDANVYILSPLTIAANENITTGTITMQGDESSITINGSLTADMVYNKVKAGYLCINDGGQLRQNNTNLNGKFVMNITTPENWNDNSQAKDGWQFISSPVKNVNINDSFVPANENQGDYDLYKYDGSKENEWVNHKANEDFETEFVSGRAYLASYEIEKPATFSGTLNADKTFARQYSYTEGDENTFKNFFLVGNPFTFNMDLSKMVWTNVVEGTAIVNANGDYEYLSTDAIIPVGDGFFIKTTGEYPSISYKEGTGSKRSEKVESINVIASSKAGKDNVIINLAGKKEGFNKLQNFNDDVATIYVENNGKNYGIVNVDKNTTEIALNFDANKMGNFTISIEPNGEFENIILVDRLTGIETNMLLEDYHFTATSNDSSNRFVIRLANGQEPTANSQFVYQSGEELILSVEGSVQIVDIMGRVVYNNEVVNGNNRIDVSSFNNGTYIVRVINEEGVKAQKVVIY